MRCVACRVELLPGKQFCHACGTLAGRACTTCGSALEPGFRFCQECGAPAPAESTAETRAPAPVAAAPVALARDIPAVLAAKIRASQGVIAGERKLVTVMFCGLVGSTAIAERLDLDP